MVFQCVHGICSSQLILAATKRVQIDDSSTSSLLAHFFVLIIILAYNKNFIHPRASNEILFRYSMSNCKTEEKNALSNLLLEMLKTIFIEFHFFVVRIQNLQVNNKYHDICFINEKNIKLYYQLYILNNSWGNYAVFLESLVPSPACPNVVFILNKMKFETKIILYCFTYQRPRTWIEIEISRFRHPRILDYFWGCYRRNAVLSGYLVLLYTSSSSHFYQ